MSKQCILLHNLCCTTTIILLGFPAAAVLQLTTPLAGMLYQVTSMCIQSEFRHELCVLRTCYSSTVPKNPVNGEAPARFANFKIISDCSVRAGGTHISLSSKETSEATSR
jgi:hypothetical protein